jgi:hypothetical protein
MRPREILLNPDTITGGGGDGLGGGDACGVGFGASFGFDAGFGFGPGFGAGCFGAGFFFNTMIEGSSAPPHLCGF